MADTQRWDALDGLRAIAVVAVFLFHARVGWAQAGYLGVSVFFTLSGFLITRTLLRELDTGGSIGFRAFYVRRARRLMPAATIAVGFAVVIGTLNDLRPRLIEVVAALTGWKNWQLLADGRLGDILIIWWSLAVEEQYYLVYPFLLVLLLRVGGRRGAIVGLLALAGVSFGVVVWSIANGREVEVYYGTHGRLWEILLGCLLALAGGLPRRLRVPPLAAALVVLACQSTLWLDLGGRWQQPLRTAVTVLATVALIDGIAARPPSWQTTWMGRPLLRRLGDISYEIYLLHTTVLVLLPELRGVRLLTVGGAFLLTVLLAQLLHHLTVPLRASTPSARATISNPAPSG